LDPVPLTTDTVSLLTELLMLRSSDSSQAEQVDRLAGLARAGMLEMNAQTASVSSATEGVAGYGSSADVADSDSEVDVHFTSLDRPEFLSSDSGDAMLRVEDECVHPSPGSRPASVSDTTRGLLLRLRKEHILVLDTTLTSDQLNFFGHALEVFKDKPHYTSTITGGVARIHGLNNHQLNGGTKTTNATFAKNKTAWGKIYYRGRSGIDWLKEIDMALMAAIGVDDENQPSSTAVHYFPVPSDSEFIDKGYSPPNFGQFAHLDDLRGLNGDLVSIAVVVALENMKSTEVIHSVDGVIPWCWEHAPSTSLNLRPGQISVFLPGGVHRGPDSTVDALSRTSYFAGCLYHPELEEVTYDEPRVQRLFLEQVQGGDPDEDGDGRSLPNGFSMQDPSLSCCPHAWDLVPKVMSTPIYVSAALSKWAADLKVNLLGTGHDATLAATYRRPPSAGKSKAHAPGALLNGFERLFPGDMAALFLGEDGLLTHFIRLATKQHDAYLQSFTVQTRNEPQTLINKKGHGWHVDGRDVNYEEGSGIIILGLEYGRRQDGTKGSSSAEFRRSTRSRPYEINLSEGQHYVLMDDWVEGLHRFQCDVPRVMLRIGFGRFDEDGSRWDFADHLRAKEATLAARHSGAPKGPKAAVPVVKRGQRRSRRVQEQPGISDVPDASTTTPVPPAPTRSQSRDGKGRFAPDSA
jgi:hypothetical protein